MGYVRRRKLKGFVAAYTLVVAPLGCNDPSDPAKKKRPLSISTEDANESNTSDPQGAETGPREDDTASVPVEVTGVLLHAEIVKQPSNSNPSSALVGVAFHDAEGKMVNLKGMEVYWSVTIPPQDLKVETMLMVSIDPEKHHAAFKFAGADRKIVLEALNAAVFKLKVGDIEVEDRLRSLADPQSNQPQTQPGGPAGHGINGIVSCDEVGSLAPFADQATGEMINTTIQNLNSNARFPDGVTYTVNLIKGDLTVSEHATITKRISNDGNQAVQLESGALYRVDQGDSCVAYISVKEPRTFHLPLQFVIGQNDCNKESQLWSPGNDLVVEGVTLDLSKIPGRRFFWLDHSGQRKEYNTPASGIFKQSTYRFHPWVITDAEGNCLSILIFDENYSNKTIVPQIDL